ncbi:MAG: hypothetical protein ACLFU8_11090 [Anaerolineales bacterium]
MRRNRDRRRGRSAGEFDLNAQLERLRGGSRMTRYTVRLLALFTFVAVLYLLPGTIAIVRHHQVPPLEALTDRVIWGRLILLTATGALLLTGAFFLAGEFLHTLYGLESTTAGTQYVLLSVTGPGGDKPSFTAREGGTAAGEADQERPLWRIGGPGFIVLYNDTALVTQERGRLKAVYTRPAAHQMERFEKPYAFIDLRPRHREANVGALTEEGIPVTCTFDVTFQIDNGDVEPNDRVMFPAPRENVFKAATATWMREDARFEDKMDWESRVVGNAQGIIRGLIAELSLDELIPVQLLLPLDEEGGLDDETAAEFLEELERTRRVTREEVAPPMPLPPTGGEREQGPSARLETRRLLQRQLQEQLQKSVESLGVKIVSAYIGTIEVSDEVKAQWLDLWRSVWKAWATEQLGDGRAERLQVLETARTHAHVSLLRHVADLIHEMEESDRCFPRSVIALKFLEALRETDAPTEWMRVYLPSQSLQSLEKLERLLNNAEGNGQEEKRA